MEGTFSERLLELIQSKNLTQKELAEKAGVTEAAMSHYIKGDRFPRASVLARIADSLGTSSDYLMNGNASNAREEIDYARRLIARNITEMSKDDKMRIMSILIEED
ncbi:MAG: helix-turn-helix transcriptional regulator [Spirochaetales bacterium]|nr:helix-turn-helix transcriptional regulator [Spirochaetales bacterium]